MELNVSLIFRGYILNLDEKLRYIKKARDEDKLIIFVGVYFILNLWLFPKLVENTYILLYTLTS